MGHSRTRCAVHQVRRMVARRVTSRGEVVRGTTETSAAPRAIAIYDWFLHALLRSSALPISNRSASWIGKTLDKRGSLITLPVNDVHAWKRNHKPIVNAKRPRPKRCGLSVCGWKVMDIGFINVSFRS